MRRIQTSDAPKAIGPYSQGLVTGNLLFTAGQVAFNLEGKLVSGEIEEETHQVLINLGAILAAAGCRFSDVAQARIYITDKELFPRVNKVFAQYFSTCDYPARECVVAAPPVEGAHVEISMIAEIPLSEAR